MANKYWLSEFEKINDIENPRFVIEGAGSSYPKLKLKADVDIPSGKGVSGDKVNKLVNQWREIEDKVQAKAREIENRFAEDFMIYTFVDRKRKETPERF